MNDRQQRQYDRLVRVKNFGNANAADATTTDAATHIGKIEEIITDIDTARTGQKGASAIPHQVLVQALYADGKDIARTARAIGQEDFGFETLFPRPAKDSPAAVLLAIDTILANLIVTPEDDPATQAAKAARIAKFTAHGLAATFHTDLAANRAQYVAARDAEDTGDLAGVEDTAAIKRLVAEGKKECAFLDATYHNLYRRNTDKLAGWISANNIEDDPEHQDPTAPPTPPTP